MELLSVERPQVQQVLAANPTDAQIPPFKATLFFNKIQKIGFRLLLLGMTPEKYMSGHSIKRTFLFAAMLILFTLTGAFEVAKAMFFSRNMLEIVSHIYVSTFLFTFNWQWFFMLINVKALHVNENHIEKFNCAKSHPEAAERFLDMNVKFFIRVMICSIAWWTVNNVVHTVGPAFEFLVSYAQSGKFNDIFVFPPVFALPLWAQIIIFLCNFSSMTIILLYCIGSYSVMGIRVLKIRTICAILNEAMRNDTGEKTKMRDYIEDHVEIIKIAKEMNSQLAILNGVMFFACYSEIAEEMFAMTLFEPNGAFYFAVSMDFLSIVLILALQCFMGSMITHSLESVAFGIYESPWYTRDKSSSIDILIMTQAAQREHIQTVWFGSLKVERATILSLCRSSYAFFSLLMILQDK